MTEIESLIQKIENLPYSLTLAINGLSDEQLDMPAGANKWTIRQIAHHIADANINAYTRMKLIATEDKPILKPYNQDLWSNFADAKSSKLEPTLLLLKGLHDRWVQFLRSLPEASWTREGIHLEKGKVSLQDVLRNYASHGESHMNQIIEFREKMKW